MEYTCRTNTLQALTKKMQRGVLSLTHKLQRREGQWNTRMKSELIDSLLRNMPINPTYCIKDGKMLYTIDGVQRLSCIRDYLDGKFALSKTLDDIVINGETKQIAGKKFKKLDEDTQDVLINCELQVYEITEYTDKEVRQMFSRQNSGKKLNNKQLRTAIESDEFGEIIYSIASHPFFEKIFTKTQLKGDSDKEAIRQVLMLTEHDGKNDHISFRSNDINAFILDYQNHIDLNKIDILRQSLDKLNDNFEEIKVKPLSVPMIVYGMYCVIKGKKSTTKYIEWLKNFIKNYNTNDEYLQFCGSGTSNADMVIGRLNYFQNAVRNC